jgi:hypothetical protein
MNIIRKRVSVRREREVKKKKLLSKEGTGKGKESGEKLSGKELR